MNQTATNKIPTYAKATACKPTLRFPEFYGEWKETKLENIGSFKNGINKSKENFGFGFPFVNLMDVFGKPTISNLKLSLVNANQKELELYNLKKGDVLFIRSSVKKEGVGETSLLLTDLENTVYSGFLIRFRDEKQKLDLNFKKYCFSDRKFRKKLVSLSSTSANTNINQESLNSLSIGLPSPAEQQKIALFLSSVDDWIENLSAQRKNLEKYKKGIAQKILSQVVRFKNDNGKNFPEWTEVMLEEILIPELREIVKPREAYKAIGIRSHFRGTFQKLNSDPNKIEMDKLYVVKENDFIVNITFAWEGALAIATRDDGDGLVSHRFPTYIFNKEKYTPKYFRFVYPTARMKYLLGVISPGGAGRNRVLSKKDFLKLKITVPCLLEQEKIAEFLSLIDQQIEVKKTQIKKADEWKKGLLQQMFV